MHPDPLESFGRSSRRLLMQSFLLLLSLLVSLTCQRLQRSSDKLGTWNSLRGNGLTSSTSSSPSCQYPSTQPIKLGYLTNIRGRSNPARQGLIISGAISYAIEKINNGTLLGGRRLEFIYNDTYGQPLQATTAMLHQWQQQVVGFIGPEDSCFVEATVATALNLPMISYKCADSRVSRSGSEAFATFSRTFPPDKQVTRSVLAVLAHYDWHKFAIVAEDSPGNSKYTIVVDSLTSEATGQGLTINSRSYFENFAACCEDKRPCCVNPFSKIVSTTHSGTRIYVFLGRKPDLMKMLLELQIQGLLDNGEYVIIYVDLAPYSEELSHEYIWRQNLRPEDLAAIAKAARSLLVIVASPPSSDYPQFQDKVRDFNRKPPFAFTDPFPGKKKHITIYAAYLYDAVILYAEALNRSMSDGVCPENGREVIRRFIDRKRYQSVTGAMMNIDANGDVEGNYTVLTLTPKPERLELKGMSDVLHPPSSVMLPVGGFVFDDEKNETVFQTRGSEIQWVGGKVPLDEPFCRFDGSGCPEDNRTEIVASILGTIAVVTLLIGAVVYRNWKYEKEIAGLLWKIHLKDLQFFNRGMVECDSKASICTYVSGVESQLGSSRLQTALYRGKLVAIKELKFTRKTMELRRETKKEMKLMKEIRQDNLNTFIGAYVQPSYVWIVTEFCGKGSLGDILLNASIKLDCMFIASLVFDLISGMIYLHESDLGAHGRLTSNNCLITTRWVLKVSDFGLHQLRSASSSTRFAADRDPYLGYLWTAPELLHVDQARGTQKGDVYSFAIILHEIISRNGPFNLYSPHNMFSAKQIVLKVRDGSKHFNEQPFRPDSIPIQAQDYILSTMKECWLECPELRPEFRSIRTKLKPLRAGLKANIMDNMISMMERYADNLEGLVEERTAQLAEEKKKTEALLHRMLPKSVAYELMRGEAVVPETFSNVTIFFSDIVGFTALSASSTPMEVVTFLNELYTSFDSIISNYDVYKVETIGDAYMVVSGLPIRNGDRHASEIASMALELLDFVQVFKISHRPDETLQLRIGIHSGSVVSGVVGTTMPRYCLFGDTVNTASRMESNGQALKIHISEECASLLKAMGDYVIKERGFVTMKGKGEVKTFWLEGHADGVKRKRDDPRQGAQEPLFATFGNTGQETKKALPRRASNMTFRGAEGSLMNVPAIMRLQVDEGLGSTNLGTQSPRSSNRKIFNKPRSHSIKETILNALPDISNKSGPEINHKRSGTVKSKNSRKSSQKALFVIGDEDVVDDSETKLKPLIGDNDAEDTAESDNDIVERIDLLVDSKNV